MSHLITRTTFAFNTLLHSAAMTGKAVWASHLRSYCQDENEFDLALRLADEQGIEIKGLTRTSSGCFSNSKGYDSPMRVRKLSEAGQISYGTLYLLFILTLAAVIIVGMLPIAGLWAYILNSLAIALG